MDELLARICWKKLSFSLLQFTPIDAIIRAYSYGGELHMKDRVLRILDYRLQLLIAITIREQHVEGTTERHADH